jgi:flagellar assembly factor FliW
MAQPITEDVVVQSRLLGSLEVLTSQIYHFPDELYGFPDAREFALVPAEREGFFWLQSVDFDALTFLLIDPFLFVDGYWVDFGSDELGSIQPKSPSDVLVLSIVTLPREQGEPATVNLQGPVVFNISRRLGKQVVVESSYGIRHPVPLAHTA